MSVNYYLFLFIFHFTGTVFGETEKLCFPKYFKFGVATSAYQTEGAWNVSGRGESIWDRFSHKYPQRIDDHTNGDVADDSYHLFKEDVAMVKSLGAEIYRFSISWTRILPTGYSNFVNPDGVRYYKEVIQEVIANGLIPMVTMYHWDLPQSLQDLGGWTNPDIAEYFKDYAKVLLDQFGDIVPIWNTINEPITICLNGYGANFAAPGTSSSGIQSYLCGHHILRAHAAVYRMFDEEYRKKYNSVMGIVVNSPWIEAATTSTQDSDAAERARQFLIGWFFNPIFSKEGDYPQIMRERINKISKIQKYARSRLPYFTEAEVRDLIGSSDFMGFNHYSTMLASYTEDVINVKPSYDDDMSVTLFNNPDWPKSKSHWLNVVPWGFRKILNYIKTTYGNPIVLVTENGISTEAGLDDLERIAYMDSYLRNLHAAIVIDKCNVRQYTYWSLMDNYEWSQGYTARFGLYEVDYTSPNRTRTPRLSAEYFRNLTTTNCIPDFESHP